VLSVPEHVQAVAADLELVSRSERGPLDLVPIDGQAIQAAIVKGAKLVLRGAHHEGVAARDGDVVESQVGRGAAPAAGPARGELEDDWLAVLLVREVAAREVDLRANLVQPGGRG